MVVKNNIKQQTTWINSTKANIPKEFVMPLPEVGTTSVMATTISSVVAPSKTPLQVRNIQERTMITNVVPKPLLNNMVIQRLNGIPTNASLRRMLSGLENVEPTRRTSGVGMLATRDRIPRQRVTEMAPPTEVANKLPRDMTSDIHQLLRDKVKSNPLVVPTVVDLTDEQEEEDDEQFFDSSDQLLVVNSNKRHVEPVQDSNKRQKTNPVTSPAREEFDEELDLMLDDKFIRQPTSQNFPSLNSMNVDQLREFIETQAEYIRFCEERIELLEKRVLINESTALSEDMKKVEKENLTPKLQQTRDKSNELKRKISELSSSLKSQTPPVIEPLKVNESEALLLDLELLSEFDVTHDDFNDVVDQQRHDELEDSDNDDNIKILQVTQNVLTTQERNIQVTRQIIAQQRSHTINRVNNGIVDEEEPEDEFGGEYTNQGLETDEDEADIITTQEKAELDEFIADDGEFGNMEDESYRDDDDVEEDDDEAGLSQRDDIVEEREALKNSSDLEDNIQDSIQNSVGILDNIHDIEEISSDEEEFGDGYVSQYNYEREIDLVKLENESDAFDEDDDEIIKLTSKKTPLPVTKPTIEIADDDVEEIESIVPNTTTGQRFNWTNEVNMVLKNVFKLDSFRSNQEEAVNSTLSGLDVFVLMPTGGGKSLCYQLPALVKSGKTKGTTIVISPLISLMQDQVAHLLAKGINAAMINSKGTAESRKHIFNLFRDGLLDLIYLSPEMIGASGRVKSSIDYLYKKGQLARVVVDELHCVSSWGHDFRPDYKNLSFFKSTYPDIPMMALTATANEHVRMDILHNLGINGAQVFKQSFNRTNLFYRVLMKDKNVFDNIKTILTTKYRGKSGIIYCHSKMSCEQTSEKLLLAGVSSAFYHAGMDADERLMVQKQWQSGQIQVICATILFGMGIDKPDVRIVIHLTIPRTLEGYYQETGRAGRDGAKSECIMFFSYKDARTLQGMIQKDKELDRDGKEKHLNKLRQVLQYCDNRTDCRRQQVLQYFNEKFDKQLCRKQCDNCCNDVAMVEKDVTEYARDMVELVKSLQNSTVTLLYCQDVFKGSKSGKIVLAQDDLNPYHGKGKELDKGTIERIFFHLISQQILEEYSVMNTAGFASNYIRIGKYANTLLNQKSKKIIISFNEKSNKTPQLPQQLPLAPTRSTDEIPIAHFTQASSELRRQQSFAQEPIVLRNGFTQEEDVFINKCYMTLNEIRMRKILELNYKSTALFIPDSLLREMATKLPTNAKDYKKLVGHSGKTLDHFLIFKSTLIKLNKEKQLGNFSNLEIPSSNNEEITSGYFGRGNESNNTLATLRKCFENTQSTNSQRSTQRSRQSQNSNGYKKYNRGKYKGKKSYTKKLPSSSKGNWSRGMPL